MPLRKPPPPTEQRWKQAERKGKTKLADYLWSFRVKGCASSFPPFFLTTAVRRPLQQQHGESFRPSLSVDWLLPDVHAPRLNL